MTRKPHQTSIRLEPELVRQAESLLQRLRDSREFRAFGLSRASVLRKALAEGLRVLEQRYAGGED